MKKITATINLHDGSEVQMEWEGVSLDYLWMIIRERYPSVSSVVLSFTTPEGERR